MAEGDLYVFSKHIRVGEGRVVNPNGCDSVQGCLPHAREPRELAVQWIAPMQMAQLAPGTRWCPTCGDVRPNSYFDVLAYDADGKPTAYAHECRQCINGRDPKLAKEKFCSACKTMHPRRDFADDARYADGKYPSCRQAKQRYDAASHARKTWLDEGRLPGEWGGHRERAMA